MKKHICLLIISLMIVSIVAACGDNGNNKTDETSSSGADTAAREETTTRQPLDVPKIDYGGYHFRILSINTTITGNAPWRLGSDYYSNWTYVEEQAGEPVNDAVYTRNLKISEEYNVEIVNTEVANVYAEARKVIATGEDVYDVVMPVINESFRLAEQNYLVNLYNIPYLDLSNPWWDQGLVKELSLCNKLYTIVGDIIIEDEEMNWCIVVNKVLMDQYNISNLYGLVRESKWTLDKLHEIGTVVTHDLNGDGIIDHNDVFGYGSDYYGETEVHFYGAGEKIATLDANGYPQLTVGTERAITVVDKIAKILNDQNFMIWVSRMKGVTLPWEELYVMFKENRLLMVSASMYNVKELRTMFDDFVILPGPKYDEQQEKYYMCVTTHACNL